MIPCKEKCSAYYDGCHKICLMWRVQQAKRTEQYKRKMNYLKEQNAITSITISQYRKLSCHKVYF